MPTKDEVCESLKEVQKKFDDAVIKEKFKGFKRIIQFKFPDINANYVLRITEEPAATLSEGLEEAPEIVVEMDSSTFLGIRTKKINAVQAYMGGKFKIKGTMPDLLKMQRLL